ncbi:TPA: hypothetical protein ENX78_16030 [Candidatus Poribacteria bacterium]|nr:hypothetical protein [Candidatus Poribacteria bacterium]
MKRNVLISFIVIFTYTIIYASNAFGAVACTLNDPDRDIKSIFPQSTGYKTTITSIKEKGGDKLAKEIEKSLGDKLDPIFEANDVPHTFYTVLKGKGIIGYVHGVNQKGMYGGMQIILAIDTKGKILKFYYQKMTSPDANKFKDEKWTSQFNGLTLADFYHHDAMKNEECSEDKIAKIKSPSDKNSKDFVHTLRGIKMNLILCDKFIFNK